MGLRSQVIHASKWAIFAQLSSKVISPLILVILAKLLTPEDFGVVAVATMVISFAQFIWDAGFNKTLINYQGKDKDGVANIVLWTNVVLGIIIYILIFSFSETIAGFFHDEKIKDVVRIQALVIVIASWGSVQLALLQKALNFKTIFRVNLITKIVPAFISIPFAYYGYGYWALVYSAVVGELVKVFTLWLMSSWKPKFSYKIQLIKQLYSYGLWVTLESALIWFFVWIDSIIVGRYLGTNDMGLYRTGNYFVSMIFNLFVGSLLPVIFSAFSRLQNNIDLVLTNYLKVLNLILFIALPITFLMFFARYDIEIIVFSNNWIGISKVIGFLALTHGLSWFVAANGDIYRAIGKPNINPIISIASIPIYTMAYYWGIKYGLNMFLYVRLGLALMMIPVHMIISNKVIHLNFFILFKKIKWILLSVMIMSVCLYLFSKYFSHENNYINILLLSIIALISYSVIIIFDKSFVFEFVNTIKESLIKKRK